MDALLGLIKREVETMDDTESDLSYIKDLWVVLDNIQDELKKSEILEIADTYVNTLINRVARLEDELKNKDYIIERLKQDNKDIINSLRTNNNK